MQRAIAILVAAGWLLAGTLSGQTVTGSIVGSVADPTGLPVTGATVTLVQVATGASREARTDERGDFVFASLTPGEYDLAIAATGFKKMERKQVALSAAERLPVGLLTLEVGALTESVTVTAQGAVLQTASAERSGVVTNSQVNNLLISSRKVMDLLQLMPGVVNLDTSPQIDRYFYLNVQGNRQGTNNLSVDGMPVNNFGNGFNGIVGMSMDSVSEVRILLTNYQAEYGRNAGANITLLSKSGTRQFHGLGSYFKRHEEFNANNFFSNQQGLRKPRYRFNTWSYNIGGPAYVPKVFNRNRDKLFFFWSQEYWPIKSGGSGSVTVPTPLERAGDFSQSIDLNGRVIGITDPTTHAPFPGNVIPANRLNTNGTALLKVFPQPNFFDRGISKGAYNYIFNYDNSLPQKVNTLRLDYNISPKNQLFGSVSAYSDDESGTIGILTWSGNNWPQMAKGYYLHGQSYVGRYTRIVGPTMVNELTLGMARRPEANQVIADELAKVQRDKAGFNLGQFFPSANPYNLIPWATFGGVTGAANLQEESRFPFEQRILSTNATDSLTKIAGAHTLKAGIAIDYVVQRAIASPPSPSGNFNFGRDANNPLETGYAYANAALGVFSSYIEGSGRPVQHLQQKNVEWFVQDNWKVSRRLTLDYGLRFYWIPPLVDRDDRFAGFVPANYDPSKRVKLIQPQLVNGQRAGVNPVTGAVLPATTIGAVAPGAGDPFNGMVVPANVSSYPRGLLNDRGVMFAPRFGFAYDPSGSGKMAIRGGIGVFYQRQGLVMINNFSTYPPLVTAPTIYYGTMATLLSSSGVVFPTTVAGADRAGNMPTVTNYSFSVQRKVGFGTTVDVGYVGSLGRHLLWERNLNPVPLGANFNPANADPTIRGAVLAPAFLRPIPGYQDINQWEGAGSSHYHALEVTANRRFARGLQFGASWTWSKSMDFATTGDDGTVLSGLVNPRAWYYGLSTFDRTHVVNVSYVWDVPKTRLRNAILRTALDNWQLSGITSFVSGQPLGIGYSTTYTVDVTGTPSQGSRVVVVENPVIPKSERTFSHNFNTNAFRMPAIGTIGNAARTEIRGPGINNWDMAVFKNFPVRERANLQFRWELYNAFNHTQFSSLDTGARFDPAGAQVNTRFGQYTAARNPRIMQFALRFSF
jgi:carboxypeptidase family protein/TonB-dependent receptor-like protein